MKFKKGDLVRVIGSTTEYNGIIGTVEDSRSLSSTILSEDLLYGRAIFKNTNLELVNIKKENNTMNHDNVIPGNYDVALCSFPDSLNSDKQYAFALFDYCAFKGGHALVKCNNKYAVVLIRDIVPKDYYDGEHPVTNEIICSVDLSAIENRKQQRKRKEELRKMMDRMVAENQELVLYQAIAKDNPKMAELLNEYMGIS